MELMPYLSSARQKASAGRGFWLAQGRLGEMQEGLLKRRNQTDEQLGYKMKEGEHVVGLQERDHKPSEDSIERSIEVKSRTDRVLSEHRGTQLPLSEVN